VAAFTTHVFIRGKESSMFAATSALQIAIYGSEIKTPGRGIGLWESGYRGAVNAAGAVPVFLPAATGADSWDEILEEHHGVVVCGFPQSAKMGDVESLCLWCKQHRFPLLAIDQGLLAMNAAFGGLNHNDLPRELPEALQHRHPPEPGLRHAIMVEPDTALATIYGEGEVVVNSEHRQAVMRVASGFHASGIALDGVIEALEYKGENWFAMGVQWQPASPTASGLDIQLFRALIAAAQQHLERASDKPRRLAMAG
jgi:putative glutamine amidotransferase